MPRIVDIGVTKLTWVPGDTGIADPDAPTTAELDAVGALDLSCLMVTTYEVRADGSDTTNERAVCEDANVVVPTVRNYMGNFVLFRKFASGEPETDDVIEHFTDDGVLGWFVRRNGLPYDTAYADGQVVEVYKFLSDVVQLQGGTGEGYLKGTVPLLQQGAFRTRTVVGGESSS